VGYARLRSGQRAKAVDSLPWPAWYTSTTAERARFELAVQVYPVHRFSKPAHSTTLPPLQISFFTRCYWFRVSVAYLLDNCFDNFQVIGRHNHVTGCQP
jgi:hypothetical protein